MKKTLIIAAACFPPVIVGPAVLLGNLFRRFPADSYCVLMGRLDHIWQFIDHDSALSCRYYYTRFPIFEGQGWHYIRCILRELVLIPLIAWKGVQIVRREGVETLFAVTERHMEAAALLIHWLTRKPLVLYLPDIYYAPGRLVPGWMKFVWRLLEPVLMRTAQTVLVPSPPTQDYYYQKYGRHTEVLPHSVDLSRYAPVPEIPAPEKENLTILFTGEVSDAQLDAILNMVKIVNDFPELNARFVVVSNVRPAILKQMGVHGPNVVCRQAHRDEIPALQQAADILFLPLAFFWPNPETIRTASPSKMPEYLAAGHPILVHAPAYSYVANYARQEEFALVVDQPDPELLRQAILDLKRDGELRLRLVANARRTAQEHDAQLLSKRLQQILAMAEVDPST